MLRRDGEALRVPQVPKGPPEIPEVPDWTAGVTREVPLCGFRKCNMDERMWYECRSAKGHKGQHDMVATGEEVLD
jgi:hypothetical protein